jgi:hypothetical protein
MQAILQFFPGLVAAGVAFVATKLVAWTELEFEFGVFLAAYVVVAVSVDRGMKRYGPGTK